MVVAIPALSCFLALSSAAAQGGIYKWTDAQGRIHFSNAPIGSAVPVEKELPPASSFGSSPETPPAATAPSEPAPAAAAPPTEGEPTAAPEPTAGDEPAPAEAEPAPAETEEESANLPPQASAGLLESDEPASLEQNDLATDEPADVVDSDEETAE